ncbi:DUF262 domain-containing protein [Nocardia sp. NPDC051833]|uniref:DUF262 domain-containing protein n=1 Tax=Nocardia sp. NPDC051833 TaxID=3155674 RepID=UPI0034412ACC
MEIDNIDVEAWFDEEEQGHLFEPENEEADPASKYAKSQLRVVRETKDYQLDYLQHALQPGRELIDISPAYQRRLRWPNKKKSLLIESFLLNIPVPPIFLYERDYNSYEVIDGRQRLDAISAFLSNEYSLQGLEYWSELNGKRFKELPDVLKKGLLRRSLPAVVLLAETNAPSSDNGDDIDVRRVLFDRLNTGGIRLNPQELRNALHPGSLNALLIRMARTSAFTTAWNIPPYSEGEERHPSDELLRNALFASMADAELVLRFFALRDAIEFDRQGSLRAILDNYMQANAQANEKEIDRLSDLFQTSLRGLLGIFGDSLFRLPTNSRLSRPLYDALMVAFSQLDTRCARLDGTAIASALEDALSHRDSYDVLVGRGNTIGAVHDRVNLATSILGAGA